MKVNASTVTILKACAWKSKKTNAVVKVLNVSGLDGNDKVTYTRLPKGAKYNTTLLNFLKFFTFNGPVASAIARL